MTVRTHDYDPKTMYCTVCGQSQRWVVNRGVRCIDASDGKIRAISHIVRNRTLSEKLRTQRSER